MSIKQENTNEKPTQNFGSAKKTRDRHGRETWAIVGKDCEFSREHLRKLHKVDTTAPAVIKKAAGRIISVHKAYELNKQLQNMPEEEREALAFWLIEKDIEEKESGIYREKVIAKKLSGIMTKAQRNTKYLTEETVNYYLEHIDKSISDAVELINDEMDSLQKLRNIFIEINARRMRKMT